MTSRRNRQQEWKRNKQGGWTLCLGSRGNRVRLFQKRRDGVFYQRVWEPDRNRYDVVSLKTRDRFQAEKLGKDLLAELIKGELRESGWKVTLGELWKRYKSESQAYLQSAETTKKDARSRAILLLDFFGPECDVSTITQDDVKAYEARRKAGGLVGRKGRVTRPVCARSSDADLVLLRTMLRWATIVRTPSRRRWLHENPLQGIRNAREQNPHRPVATWERFLKTREAMQALATGSRSERDRSLWIKLELALVLAEATGRRLNSIRQLRWDDIDFTRRTIRWRAETDKKRQESTVPIPEDLIDEIMTFRKRLGALGGWVFARESDGAQPMDRHLLDKWLVVAEKHANLPKLKGGLWHPYRRKWATERKDLSLKDVAAAGGWKDIETLLRCYQQPDEETLLAVMSEKKKLTEQMAHG